MTTGLKCHALVIGINTYTDGIAPLQSAVQDATAMAELLQTDHGYSVTTLLNEQASGSAIEQFLLDTLPSKLSEESAFLLYYAGHGVAHGDGSEGPQGYLLPQNARPGDADSWLSMDTLRGAIESLPCRHLLVVLDCCFAGAFRWASTRAAILMGQPLYESQFQRYLENDAWQALTSASHDQRAADVTPGRHNQRDADAGDGHSPFAAALIRGLSGAADSARSGHEPDGVITATELYQFLFEELVPQGEDSNQTPGIWPLKPASPGEFVFLNPQAALNTVPDPPLDDDNNPWLGLSAYSENEAPLFFGRDRITKELIDKIVDSPPPGLVAVVGASGTGKSSVVKAGVLPQIANPPEELAERIGRWAIVRSQRLGADPMAGLNNAISKLAAIKDDARKLLFVDQFEELYTQCRNPDVRDQYLAKLKALIVEDDATTILLTIRSDFEPQPAKNGALADLWATARIVVPAFSGEEFRECIEGPAGVKALYFEPEALIGELVDEVMAMPGALPMLSFALAEMYRCAQVRRRDSGSGDRALTREDYETTGGVVGSLHKRASALYDASTPATQASIQRVFLRMLAQDGARLTRRRIALTELEYADTEEQARVDQVMADYVAARLLVLDSDSIEPAHDTLVVAWDKLIEWLSESGPQNMIRAVWRAATDWVQRDEEPGLSWHDDPRLPLALSKRDQLNKLEQRFIDASEKHRKWRIKRLVGVAVTIGVVILSVAAVALYQWDQAVIQKQEADNERRGALLQVGNAVWERGAAARDNGRNDNLAAHLFARSAAAFSRAGEFEKAATSLMAISRNVVATLPHDNPVLAVSFDADDARMKVLVDDGTVYLWDVAHTRLEQKFKHDVGNDPLDGGSFSADLTQILGWTWFGLVRLWDIPNEEPVRVFRHEFEYKGWGVRGALLNADQSRVLSWDDRHRLKLWNIPQDRLEATFENRVRGAFNHQGSAMLSWSDDTVWLHDTSDGKTVKTVKQEDVFAAGFTNNDSLTISWSRDWGTVLLQDMVNEKLVTTFDHEGVKGALYNDADETLLSWGNGNVQLHVNEELETTFNHAGVDGALYNHANGLFLSWGGGKVLLHVDEKLVSEFKHEGVSGAGFNHNESLVTSWSENGTVRLWDTSKDEQRRAEKTFKHQEAFKGVKGAVFNENESQVLSWDYDGTAKLWSIGDDEKPGKTFKYRDLERDSALDTPSSKGDDSELKWLEGEPEHPPHAMFTDGESKVLSWDIDGTVHLWNTANDEKPETVFALTAAAGAEGMIANWPKLLGWFERSEILHLWDIRQDEPPRQFRQNSEFHGAIFNTEGSRVLSWGEEMIQLWEIPGDGPPVQPERTFEHPRNEWIMGASFNRNESRVLSWDKGGGIQLWNIAQGEVPEKTLKHGDGFVYGAVFNGDETKVLSWGENGLVRLWDIKLGEPITTLQHDGIVFGAVFNSDESRVLTWSWETMRLWDIERDEWIMTFQHDAKVYGAVFNSDGSRVLSWGQDGTARIWEIPKIDDLSPDSIEAVRAELEIRNASTINEQGVYRLLKLDEWMKKRSQLVAEK